MTNFTDPRMAVSAPLFSRSYGYHSPVRKYLFVIKIIALLWGPSQPIKKRPILEMPDDILSQVLEHLKREAEVESEQVPDGIIFGGH